MGTIREASPNLRALKKKAWPTIMDVNPVRQKSVTDRGGFFATADQPPEVTEKKIPLATHAMTDRMNTPPMASPPLMATFSMVAPVPHNTAEIRAYPKAPLQSVDMIPLLCPIHRITTMPGGPRPPTRRGAGRILSPGILTFKSWTGSARCQSLFPAEISDARRPSVTTEGARESSVPPSIVAMRVAYRSVVLKIPGLRDTMISTARRSNA